MSGVLHGGPDGGPVIRHDFSSNASPLGPPPALALALANADRQRYPDPSYGALREALAAAHGVAPARVLPTAGTSEAIRRLTLAVRLRGIATVWAPRPGYGDYAAAAHALGLTVRTYDGEDALLQAVADRADAALIWICEPCNPTGSTLCDRFWAILGDAMRGSCSVLALDRAYEPLRLVGRDPVPETIATRAWQCVSPNKSLGLTGVRVGYLIAPRDDPLRLHADVEALAPSWVLSAEGVALLCGLHAPQTQAWLAESRAILSLWAQHQRDMLARLGWIQRPSVVPFWLARPPGVVELPGRLAVLREAGIKLRDATSLGLPGWVRVSAQPLASQLALRDAWVSFP